MKALRAYGHTIVIQIVYTVGTACLWIRASHAFFSEKKYVCHLHTLSLGAALIDSRAV